MLDVMEIGPPLQRPAPAPPTKADEAKAEQAPKKSWWQNVISDFQKETARLEAGRQKRKG